MTREKDLAFFEDDYPDEVDELFNVLDNCGIDSDTWLLLFSALTEAYIYEGYSNHKLNNSNFYLDIDNTVAYHGSGEHSSSESSTSVYIKEDGTDKVICEIYYSIGDAHCCDSRLLSFEVIPAEEEEEVAQLRVRENGVDGSIAPVTLKVEGDGRITGIHVTGDSNHLPNFVAVEPEHMNKTTSEVMQSLHAATKIKLHKGDYNMSTISTVNITLIDTNNNVKGAKKVVFQKLNVVTEYNDEQTKMNVIATGDVMKELVRYNEKVRTVTVDKAILRSTGNEVFLEPIELLSDSELEWSIIKIA